MAEDVSRQAGGSAQARLTARLDTVRERYADVRIETTLAVVDDDLVVVRALVTTADAGSSAAHVARVVPRKDARAATIELAEIEAIETALDRMGLARGEGASRRPVRATASTAASAPAPSGSSGGETAPPVVNALRQSQPQAQGSRPPASRSGAVAPSQSTRETLAPPPGPGSAPETTAAAADDEDDLMADYSWTAFWVWAKAQNISTRGQINQLLGHPVDNMTPRAIRRALVDQGKSKP